MKITLPPRRTLLEDEKSQDINSIMETHFVNAFPISRLLSYIYHYAALLIHYVLVTNKTVLSILWKRWVRKLF